MPRYCHLPFSALRVTKILGYKNMACRSSSKTAYIANGSVLYSSFSPPKMNVGRTINMIPHRTKPRLKRFNFSIGSLRNILAYINVKKVLDEDTIVMSPMGMCFTAKYPKELLHAPITERKTKQARLPTGNIGSFLQTI